MKRFIFGLIALGIIAGTTIFISCNNNNKNIKCDCSVEPDATEQVTFNLMNKSISSEFYIWKYEEDGNNRESVSATGTDENLFQLFKNYCAGKNLVFGNQVMAFVLYYNSLVSENLSVTDNNIKGISVYTVKGYKITHSLYLRDENNNFYEEENVKVQVPAITSNHMSFYLEKYVFSDTEDNKSFIVFANDLALKVEKNRKKYWAPMVYEVKSKQKAPITYLLSLPGSGCGSASGCENGNWTMACIWVITNKYTCDYNDPAPTCPGPELAEYGGEQFVQVCYPLLMYAFRDDFLSKYDKGKKYIDDYYYLGGEWKGNLNFELAIQTAEVLKDFNPVMLAFLEPDKYMDEVMFDTKLSTSLLNLLDSYEKITKSNEGKKILNSIREDIKMYENRRQIQLAKL